MKDSVIAFDPCPHCENHDMCLKCELTFRRNWAIENPCEWVSVEERLPDKEGTYLTYTDKDKMLMDVFCIYPSHGTRFWVGGNGKVTHWMPLPEPPKGGEG